MAEKKNHITSLRIPAEWNTWVLKFAEKYNVPPAYVYRSAIREFISVKGGI